MDVDETSKDVVSVMVANKIKGKYSDSWRETKKP
jgi:hypothetical protein